MRYFIGCLFSAFLGAMLAISWTDSEPHNRAEAEETVVAQDIGNSENGTQFFQKKEPRGPQFPDSLPEEPIANRPRLTFNQKGLTPDEAINVAVYERVNKSVVNITTKSVGGFFLFDGPTEGTGSGMVFDKAGHILTNYHVIEDARHVAVTLYSGKTFQATLVGADPINDVAVIKIDASKESLFPVTLGDSSNLLVGMRVFAIGNPFGLERTMTSGIISSLNRSLKIHGNRSIRSIIQIDASVNPGNSGGPLLNSHGQLIGINTAIASRTGQSAGVGFAIPVNMIARVVPQLVKFGRVIRAESGIQRVYETESGLLITRLTPNGPADRAGLRGPRVIRSRRGPFIIEQVERSAADMIVAVDDQKVETADDFLGYIESKKPGDRVVLTIIREERKVKIPVVLGGDDDSKH